MVLSSRRFSFLFVLSSLSVAFASSQPHFAHYRRKIGRVEKQEEIKR
jgi:hypothetical protein